ncbi:Syntaxin 6, N-terminal [Ostreococcus tauri]|uniref:Syntaxin 6, N-terminal n=1 Tax=Ostreococcus tauri TaxID=70448 RepID=A0A090N442_OSTTA|nr:Syntaxin 6, N-terminal [Ostreococcus tauri]CEF99213.1 Syntaxin 6, N-terminal [Ostreococcus tauri]|eukprot:XP_003081394.2 Syntaxin 6, N-terminal [Ostreococcus tauri]
MAPRAADPYYVVRDELDRRVDALRQRCAETSGGGNASALTELMRQDAEGALWELDELDRATTTASKDLARYGLTREELEERWRWSARERERVREVMSIAARRAGGTGGTRTADDAGDATRRDVESGRTERGFDDHQQLLVRRQDEDLDDISASISRIGQVGLTIGEELASQSKMLEELDEDVDGVQARLKAAELKMRDVLKKAGLRGQLCVIVFLSVVLFVLFYVAFAGS